MASKTSNALDQFLTTQSAWTSQDSSDESDPEIHRQIERW